MGTDFDTLTSNGKITQTVRYGLTYRRMGQMDDIYGFLLFIGHLKVIVCIGKSKVMY